MAGYAEIAAHYRTLIERGELSPGDRLPTLREVMREFGVAQKTAARAYAQLKSEGLTAATTGGGTVVAAHLPTARSGAVRSDRVSAGLSPLLRGEAVVGRNAGWRSVDDADVAEALGLDLRDEVVVRTRVFTRGEIPSVYAVSVYHPRAAVALPELALQGPGLTNWEVQYQERTGLAVHRSPDRYGARIATPYELDSLLISRKPWEIFAVLTVTVLWHDDRGPLAYWEDIYAPGLSANP
ncbi:GntR family transcriptional regulator [Kitasatospora cineracea]|uniref:GntR family transcriptional regulator n=1 Tax=Kitasatospora cineracea TaxID=88074 RepID=UPI00340FCBA1